MIEISDDDFEDEDDEPEKEYFPIDADNDNDRDFLIVKANDHPRTAVEKKKKIFNLTLTNESLEQFTCDYCLKTFKAKQGLTRHVQSHIENSVPWNCKDCHFAVSSRIKLNVHRFRIHGVPLPLAKADNYPTKKKILKTTGHGFSCFCGATFESTLSLRAHRNRMHGSRNKCKFGCENVQYVKTGHFIRHVMKMHPEKMEECLKQINSLSPSKSSPTQPELFSCDKCDFTTSKKISLKSHLASHLPFAARNKFECQRCHKTFTRATSLRIHLLTVHDKIRRHKCPQCGEEFRRLALLNDHLLIKHHQMHSFNCNFCSQTFEKRSLLEIHRRELHKFKKFATRPNDSDKKRFLCSCGKSLPTKNILMKHQLTHKQIFKPETVKKFKCPVPNCFHAFKQRCNLIRHQKEKEHFLPEQLNKLKYKCVCGARFFTERGYSFHCGKSMCVKQEKTLMVQENKISST